MTLSTAERAWLHACYRAWRHIRDDHGLENASILGSIDTVHLHAHQAEGTPWHDPWIQPRPAHHDDGKQPR